MRQFLTERRLNRIVSAVKARQHSLHVVLENIHDPHNVSAIFRSCDAVGVPKVSLLYNNEEFPKLGKVSSASATKWVDKQKFKSVDSCFGSLRKEGFKIYATLLDEEAVNLYDLNLTEKCVIVMGNEHRGVSEEAAEKCDKKIYIPMHGMIQSLNVSVATAVILYEAQRQRLDAGMYEKSELQESEIEKIIDDWVER